MMSGFRRVYPGGATTGPLPSAHPPVRLPSGLSRRGHNWSATDSPPACAASVGFIPAGPQLVGYRQPTRLSGFRRVYPGGATTGPLPTAHPPVRLPSGSSRRGHNWSATIRPSTCAASVGFIPAEPQLVRYHQAIHLCGFRRVYPGGATTGRLPTAHPPVRLPSGLSRRGHNWSATIRPSTCAASVGFIPAGPQLVGYRQPTRLCGFRRVYPGGATTGRLGTAP